MKEEVKGEERQWYAVVVPSSHEGAGSHGEHTNYVLAVNAVDALSRVKSMGGWHRSIGRNPFPNVRPLTQGQSEELEEEIQRTDGVTLEQARERGFHGRRR